MNDLFNWFISQGGKGAGYRVGSEEDTYDNEGKRMFHVRGSSDMNAKAMQVCATRVSSVT